MDEVEGVVCFAQAGWRLLVVAARSLAALAANAVTGLHCSESPHYYSPPNSARLLLDTLSE